MYHLGGLFNTYGVIKKKEYTQKYNNMLRWKINKVKYLIQIYRNNLFLDTISDSPVGKAFSHNHLLILVTFYRTTKLITKMQMKLSNNKTHKHKIRLNFYNLMSKKFL